MYILFQIFWITTHYGELFFLDHPGDIASAYQIVRDWNTQPFVTISIHDRECPEEYEAVFPKIWKGTEKGCFTPDGEKANRGEAVVVVPEG